MTSTAQSHFKAFEPTIRDIFAGIVTEAGCETPIQLLITDAEEIRGTRLNAARTVFEAIVPEGPVRITWDALAVSGSAVLAVSGLRSGFSTNGGKGSRSYKLTSRSSTVCLPFAFRRS